MLGLNGGHTQNDPVLVQSSDQTHDQKAPDATTYASPPRDGVTPAAWGTGWRCPTMMVVLVFSGAMFSMGHHLYYQSLDNTRVNSVDQQTWAIRIGTGFAFLIKSFFVSAIGIAGVQQMWATLRRKFVKIRGIDGMFSVLTSPLGLLTLDVWMCAKTLVLLSIMSWLIPLTAIVTPATLTINLLTTTNITNIRVPTVNFALDAFWHPWATFHGAGMISSPAATIDRLFTATYSSAEVVPFSAPSPNSSYTLEFWGPSYKCQKLSEAVVEMKGMNLSDSARNYGSLQNEWNYQVANKSLRFPVVYSTAVSTALNNTIYVFATGSNPLWNDNATQPTELVCQLWNTSYVVNLNFTNGIRTLTPISTKHVARSNWDGRSGELTTTDFPLESDVNGGFYLTHLLFSDLLRSTMIISSIGSLTTFLTSTLRATNWESPTRSIQQTGLFACPDVWNSTDYNLLRLATPESALCRNKTLARAIEDLSHNFTYSLLSLNGANSSLPVTISSPQNFYSYDSKNLLAAYMTALGVTVACVIVGLFALRENGVAQSTSFSSMLMTTRNPELDHLTKGHCLGSDVVPDAIGDIKLRFGEVEGSEQYKHAAFGTEETVAPMSKGKEYY
ncbi:uncharacterized protein PGRI_033210 [Penicillium griseofulvum]|uniref:Uncharacterized protein n=1 Tax=Penicillium patulum TaxID=5078 RepID=A0A135L9E6_PENPA|nr:uncharacterized protein PGRI_033210 [Penicillium griseofulvum]KXG45554.1 hypothetical protein PGRI_033210 [Penicillium griseofulvum]